MENNCVSGCPYHCKFIFILSFLCYPISIPILGSKMSDPVTFIPLCYWKSGAPEILSLVGVKLRLDQELVQLFAMPSPGSSADLFLLKALSVAKVSWSRGGVGIGVCCSYMKGAKWKMARGTGARTVFTMADTN